MLFGFAKRPLIMGILNVTPDSFSGDGLLHGCDYSAPADAIAAVTAAVDLAAQMVTAGADLLDIGGESSRPGSAPVSAEEEIRRTVPVIAAIGKKFPSLPLAVDTVKSQVAEAALDAGATIVNDISSLRGDDAMAALVVKRGAWLVLMHNRSDPALAVHDAKIGGEFGAPDSGETGGDIVGDVLRDLRERTMFAEKSGIAREKIIIDPGIGFGKTVEQNLALSRSLDRLKASGYPVLTGPSRKSFIGRVLDLPVDERLEGTAALVAIAAFQGVDIIRVHDVKFMARVAKMAGAVKAN
jgi:dihydropteroate synthase